MDREAERTGRERDGRVRERNNEAGSERPTESGCDLPPEGLDRLTNPGQLGLGGIGA
jgi:hypothetical protein